MSGIGRPPAASVAAAAAVLAVVAAAAAACGRSTPAGLAPAPPTTAAPSPTTTEAVPTGRGVLVTGSGVVLPVLSGAAGRWTVRTPCGQQAVVTAGTPVPRATIVLDPGHGGDERGAVSPGGLTESTVNLAVARRASATLAAAGVAVQLTRQADYDLAIPTRAAIAEALSPRALVSLHHNAEPDGPHAGPGTETYYQQASPESKRLAGLVYEEVARALAAYRVAWVADTDAGAKYRPGARGDYYAILRLPSAIPTVLAELAYITNPPEADLLARPDVQAVEGDAVARGILRWLRTSDPGSGFTVPYPRTEPAGGTVTCTDPRL
ncbi:MAG: N-acetylmuramoyl-L-alanine amidase [Acidimicrobiales bacterium]